MVTSGITDTLAPTLPLFISNTASSEFEKSNLTVICPVAESFVNTASQILSLDSVSVIGRVSEAEDSSAPANLSLSPKSN